MPKKADKIDARDWTRLTASLTEDPHIIEVATRVWEVDKIVAGIRGAHTLEETIREVAQGVAMLKSMEGTPDFTNQTTIHGYFVITQGPHDGWSVAIRVGSIYNMHTQMWWDSKGGKP